MLLKEIFIAEGKDDDDHGKALQQTGFWGKEGAGSVIFARDTKRFLIAHRSPHVEQPGTWGTWGGAIDRSERPAQAAQREVEEEAGYNGPVSMVPLYVFEAMKEGKVVFRYHNFLAVVENEFHPRLNWESQGFQWCEFGQWPKPLHFGLQGLLSDPHSIQVMQNAAQSA